MDFLSVHESLVIFITKFFITNLVVIKRKNCLQPVSQLSNYLLHFRNDSYLNRVKLSGGENNNITKSSYSFTVTLTPLWFILSESLSINFAFMYCFWLSDSIVTENKIFEEIPKHNFILTHTT